MNNSLGRKKPAVHNCTSFKEYIGCQLEKCKHDIHTCIDESWNKYMRVNTHTRCTLPPITPYNQRSLRVSEGDYNITCSYWNRTLCTVTHTKTCDMMKQNTTAWGTGSKSRIKGQKWKMRRFCRSPASKLRVKLLGHLKSCRKKQTDIWGAYLCVYAWTHVVFSRKVSMIPFFSFIPHSSLICLLKFQPCIECKVVRGLALLTLILLSFIWIFFETSSAQ